MIRNILLSVGLLAVAAFADDEPAINPQQAPLQFCHAVDNISNYTRGSPEHERVRISPGVVCSRENATNGNCEIEAGGFFTLDTIYNETESSEWRLSSSNHSRVIDWSIYNVTGDYGPFFGHQSFGAVANTTLTFAPGDSRNSNSNSNSSISVTAAYATFAGIYQCVVATFSDCPEGLGIDNGTVIETCYPKKTDDEIQEIWTFVGQPVVEFTNVTYAASIPDNQYSQRPRGLATSGAVSVTFGNAAIAFLVGTVGLVVLA